MSRLVDPTRAAALALALLAAPALAQSQDKPAANRTPDAEDVAMTPITDLNLRKDEIAGALLAAAADPYASVNIRGCADIAAALTPLDAALGPDMDVVQDDGERVSAGAVAKSVVASFIPFRGIIRELTGAADHQRDFQAAIYAGAVRRGYLKGLGQQMNCPYPSRPAFTRIAIGDTRKAAPPAAGSIESGYVAQPVIQEVPAGTAGTPRTRRR